MQWHVIMKARVQIYVYISLALIMMLLLFSERKLFGTRLLIMTCAEFCLFFFVYIIRLKEKDSAFFSL